MDDVDILNGITVEGFEKAVAMSRVFFVEHFLHFLHFIYLSVQPLWLALHNVLLLLKSNSCNRINSIKARCLFYTCRSFFYNNKNYTHTQHYDTCWLFFCNFAI